MRPVRLLIRVTAAATAASAGTVQRLTSVMANTNSHGNQAISPNQSTDRGGRAPFFFNLIRERASKRARREGGPEGHELVSERASLRAVREQVSVDVAPVVLGQRGYFPHIGQ